MFRKLTAFLLLAFVTGTQAQTIRYIHTDALGSVAVVTDANRNVVDRREYEPYGQQLSGAMSDGPGYTGHVQDVATSFNYMQQRYYDPKIGAFLSVDPVTVDGISAWNLCRYCYAANNPYKFKDPDGRIIDTIADIGFIAYDVYKLATEPSWTNAGALGADVVGAVIPFATGLGAGVRAGVHGAEAVRGAEKAAEAGKAARAGHNGVEGPAKLETRTTRAGEPAGKVTYPDGSVKDVSPSRVKEFVPQTHPNAPSGTMQKVKFEDAQPGTKGYKRDPTPDDLKEAGIRK